MRTKWDEDRHGGVDPGLYTSRDILYCDRAENQPACWAVLGASSGSTSVMFRLHQLIVLHN